jgi:hypothetical protein
MQIDPKQVPQIIEEARQAARAAAQHYLVTKLNGQDWMPCGFAWCSVMGVKGSTKLGRALVAAGFRKEYGCKALQMWDPAGLPIQNVDAKLAGATAAANVLQRYGFDAYASSRLD